MRFSGYKDNAFHAIYHVMLRGINRQDIFECPNDYFLFIGIMGMVLLIHLTEIFGGIMFVSTNKDCHKDWHLLS